MPAVSGQIEHVLHGSDVFLYAGIPILKIQELSFGGRRIMWWTHTSRSIESDYRPDL